MDVGFCVTVTPTKYIYTGGQEDGVVVGIRNYPRFPSTEEELEGRAIQIARELMEIACQWSCMIEDSHHTIWLSNRHESGEGENG